MEPKSLPQPLQQPDSEEIAPVTAPGAPGRSILGVVLIVFGLAVLAAALVILLVQWLWGAPVGDGVEPAGLWLAALTGLLWAGTGLAIWRRMWVVGLIGTVIALIVGAIATGTIRS